MTSSKAIKMKRIDGKKIASAIFANLARRTSLLKKRRIIPTLAVILVGNDPASITYIRQKKKAAEKIGANLTLRCLEEKIQLKKVESLINTYNKDAHIHGIIIQLPLPKHLDISTLIQAIKPQKDVDGFVKESPFTPPVAGAVITIIRYAHGNLNRVGHFSGSDPYQFQAWLSNKRICILGRGQTAGKPIANTLKNIGCRVSVVHSKTKYAKKYTVNADILISCVGKKNTIKSDSIKRGAILISVGLHKAGGKLHGDYRESDIANKASFYTPTPGGVGPVNVAHLWENVVKAAEQTV